MTTTDDDLAARVTWEPLRRGGSDFATHRLVEVAPGRVAFVATPAARRFAWLFVAIGAAAPLVVLLLEGGEGWPALVFAGLFGTLFVGAGALLGREFDAAVTFDLAAGTFDAERRLADRERGPAEPRPPLRLADVAALQLVPLVPLDRGRGRGRGRASWELDLVLADARRVYVVGHGGRAELGQDAGWLAERLGVPLWDAGARTDDA